MKCVNLNNLVIVTASGGDEFLPSFRDWLISHWSTWLRFVEAMGRILAPEG